MNLECNIKNDIEFLTKKCADLTDDEIDQSSILFSEHYGIYSSLDKDRPGKQIKLPSSYYKKFKNKSNYYAAFAKCKGEVVGQAYYLLKETDDGIGTWILQLVVHSSYRKLGIGKTLLYSIWGISDYYAWGLATANPLTVKTLESATFRKVNRHEITNNESHLSVLAEDIDFIRDFRKDVRFENAPVDINTRFFVDHHQIDSEIEAFSIRDFKSSHLEEGYEWLAFTFASQSFDFDRSRSLESMFEMSESVLKHAYARMQRDVHPWTKSADREIDYIKGISSMTKESLIYDFGCGNGRHIRSLYNQGYRNVKGYEFINEFVELNSDEIPIDFGDCRTLRLDSKADIILCLYDVIGSFADDSEKG